MTRNKEKKSIADGQTKGLAGGRTQHQIKIIIKILSFITILGYDFKRKKKKRENS